MLNNVVAQSAAFEFPTCEGEHHETVNTYILLSAGFVKGSLRIKSEALSRTKEGKKRTDLIKFKSLSR